MAEFEAKVYKLTIEEHPNADRLELARVGDYRSIVQKGQFKTGDLGVYIPEAAVVPEWLIAELGLEGRLAGKQKNRVKAVKLRGVLSQGLVYPVVDEQIKFITTDKDYLDESELQTTGEGIRYAGVREGDDVTEYLGLVKYEPPIPVHMAGEVASAFGKTVKYDIENWKKYPDTFKDGEEVVFTEKIHGTWCCFGYHPDITHAIVTSKGLSERGLIFKLNDANKDNLYVRALRATEIDGDDVVTRYRRRTSTITPFYILGEIYGRGVQDLAYGAEKPQFRVFDVYVGEPSQLGRYLNHEEVESFAEVLGLDTVPAVYRGSFSKEVMDLHTSGKETLSGKELNIREGIVIKPCKERGNLELGRVILKSVSEGYLLRKGGTEFN